MANFDYKPEARLIKSIIEEFNLTVETCIIHQPTKFGNWHFEAIADFLREELGVGNVWQLIGKIFKDGYFSFVSGYKIPDMSVIEWGMPDKAPVLIFTNFSDLDKGGIDLWLEIGKSFREEGIRPKVITQLPSHDVDISLRTNFDIYILYDDEIVPVNEVESNKKWL